jgi:hypothetical protein
MSNSEKIPTSAPETSESNRLSIIESISYTSVIGFIAALAAGLFDGMVPWK